MNSKRRIAVLSLLLGTLLFSFVLSTQAFASPVADKKARLREVQARLQSVYHEADLAVEKYNQATSQLTTVQQQVTQNEHLLKVAEYNLAVANRQLQSRAQDIYKTRDVGIVDVLFSSNSFDDLITQMNMMERLGNSDVDTVRSITAYQRDIKNRRVKLEADKQAAARLVTERAAQKGEVLAVQGRLERMTAGIKNDIQQLEAQQAAAARAAAQAAAADLRTPAADSRVRILAAIDTLHAFPGHGGIAGLINTLAEEWPGVIGRTLALAGDEPIPTLAPMHTQVSMAASGSSAASV
ncbi:MAG: hypothetical protein WCN81_13585 [Actinomycetes bacterium]